VFDTVGGSEFDFIGFYFQEEEYRPSTGRVLPSDFVQVLCGGWLGSITLLRVPKLAANS